MRLVYGELKIDDLRGSNLADYLVGIEADFQLLDRRSPVYEEPYFPVVELARSLARWSSSNSGESFVFDSMSFGNVGAVSVWEVEDGWVFGSRLTPEVVSDAVGWDKVQNGVILFVAQVRADLLRLGIDPDSIFMDD